MLLFNPPPKSESVYFLSDFFFIKEIKMVYVSPMHTSLKNKNWPYKEHCYLVADTVEELHEFAVKILRLKRSWFQDKTMLHYDITFRKRRAAILNGAMEISNL